MSYQRIRLLLAGLTNKACPVVTKTIFMTKTKTVVSLLVLLGLLSFTPSNNSRQNGLLKGDKIEISNAKELKEAMLANNGTLVLINTWASYDANSHIENIRLAKVTEKYKEKQFKNARGISMIALSFDTYKSVFNETVRRDDLTEVQNFMVKQGFQSEIAKSYEFEKDEFGNFLLDAQGVIIAKNISAKELEILLQQH